MGEVAASHLLWVLIMYVYRDVTSRALQCINVTSTVTRDSTACCFEVDLWQEPNGGEKNGTSIGQRWDVFTGLQGCPLYIGHVYAHHHKWYITRDVSICRVGFEMCVWELFWNCCGTESSLDTCLLFVRFVFFFSLLQWLLVLLFETRATPTRDGGMEGKFWTKQSCNPTLFVYWTNFISAFVCCSLFYTPTRPLSPNTGLHKCYSSTVRSQARWCRGVRWAKLSEDSSGLLSWKH